MIKELGVETNNFDLAISCVDKDFNVAKEWLTEKN